MSEFPIHTVTGSTTPDKLGRTLMHEHLLIGYPGWEADTLRPGATRDEMFAVCVDKIEEMKAHGITAMVDPCPNDLGRDVEFMAEVAQRTDFQIICATGLYKQAEGGTAYWQFRGNFGDNVDAMTELFIHELTQGIGSTGVRAGIIKVATGHRAITDYERTILTAAAKAAVETGAPITTHTDAGTLGDEQQQIFTEAGVPAQRIVIGHSCGTSNHDYHMKIASGGSYLGFDRFGLDFIHPDAERVAALLRLLERGAGDRVVVSHDSVWCWRGQPIPDAATFQAMGEIWNPLHFTERIAPRLLEGGATQHQIDALLIENPKRFFAGEKLAALAA
ncbi:MAG: phosphotriesterase-related protein [Myxococcales bacterium]|nr:phosphotriesterase-related protein [Myxococcales bacterium]